jgi:hypothetical protein
MDVVVFGPRLAMSDADRRRLAARARERGGVIISAGPWSGAHMRLAVESANWRGLGAGDGRLREREMTVTVSSRAGGQVRRVLLTLDSDTGPRRGTRDSVGQAAAYEGAA